MYIFIHTVLYDVTISGLKVFFAQYTLYGMK